MKRPIKPWIAVLAAAAWLVCIASYAPAAQEAAAQSEQSPAAASTPQAAALLTPAQLDQLTAPIALDSDPLLGMILTAATYPLEVVEAARWLDADDHASLHGDALDSALAPQSWATSVKALVAVPEVLRMMNQNLEWTEQLGNAFLSQQADVMDSIQRLRQRAAASGALQSSPQETVSTEDGDVVIEPPSPEVIYIPCYAPAVYGPWPWPAYPPFYFPFPPDYCYGAGLITFGIGFGIIGPYWGWGRWNWRGHGFYVVPPRRPHRGPLPMRPWVHNPAHRHGVPYPNRATAQRYLGPNARTWRGYRGFPARPAPTPRPAPGLRIGPGNRPGAPGRGPIQRGPIQRGPIQRGPIQRGPIQRGPIQRGPIQRGPIQRGPIQRGPIQRGPIQRGPIQRGPIQRGPIQPRPMPHPPRVMRQGPPVFQSYGPGPRVRSDAARGAFSRSAPGPRGGRGGRGGSGRGGGRPPH